MVVLVSSSRSFTASFGFLPLFADAAGAGVGAGSACAGAVFVRFDPRVNTKSPSSSSYAASRLLLLLPDGCWLILKVSKGFRVLMRVVIDTRFGSASACEGMSEGGQW